MKKLLFLLPLFIWACAKEPIPGPSRACTREVWGNIQIQNFSDNRFLVTIEGVVENTTVDAGGITTFEEIAIGVYSVFFKNETTGQEGFLNDPIQVKACEISLIPLIF